MDYKKMEHYLFICLLKQITMILYVSGTPTGTEETKLLSEEQLNSLVGSVCLDLYVSNSINVTQKTCEKKFKAPDPSQQKLAPPLKIRCRMKHSIRFQIEPSENWQLVLLLPERSNNSYADLLDTNYGLVEPNIVYGQVTATPRTNYTIWSTKLNEGTPLKWHGGDEVTLYESMVHKSYIIKKWFVDAQVLGNMSVVDGWFTWNTSDVDSDVCFDVVNSCDDSYMKEMKIWPNYNDDEPQIIFKNLSTDVTCNIEVTGLYGATNLTYNTPSSDFNCSSAIRKPEIPKKVTIHASEDAFDTWKVRVAWAPPHCVPDQYNVTLRTHIIRTVVVPGDATEAVIEDVVGEGQYNVSVYAILGHTAGHTSRLSTFPSLPATARGGGTGSAALGAVCAGAAALALLWRCRRRRHRVVVPPYKPDDKYSKEGDTEVLEVWSESEDRWEVRTDKLVLHEVIGEGAFGVVRRATLAPHSSHVAVKMLKDFPSPEEIRSFRSEMELMKSVGVHAHLVSLVGCCSGRRPLIIAEYCSRGDLLSYLRCTWDAMLSKRTAKYYNNNIDTSDYRNDLFKCKTQMENSKLVVNKLYELQDICDRELTALDLLSFCRQIAMGMEFLAANRVVHRDLAARNVLVTADRTLKIADFGLSRDVYEENQYKQKGNGKMPVKWMALESLTRRIYTTQSDVWSFGVVVWEIATVGGAPYASVPGARLPRLLRAGYRMPRPNNCSPQLYDIMLSCWRTHPRERPTFAELHQRLDELLNSACANHYLSLEVDADDAPPTPKHYRYIKMLIRGKRNWTRENYERPLKAPHTNHYTTPPDSLSSHPV